MSKILKVGSVIRLNPAMFKENFKMDGHFGNLGYPGIMRDWFFKVMDNKEHSYHGDTVICEPLNVKGCEGVIRLRTEETQPAVMKRTVEYTVMSNDNVKNALTEELRMLDVERTRLKATGKYKISGRLLTTNKKNIDTKRAELEVSSTKGNRNIFIPKINKTIVVDSSMLSKKDELEMLISQEITDFRDSRKAKEELVAVKATGYESHKVKKLGGVNVEPYTYGKLYELGLATFINENKIPTDPTKQYVGIEIECITKCDREALKKLFIAERLHKHVNVTDDSSIAVDAAGFHSAELRILATEEELESVMMRVQRVMTNKLVKAYTNNSCGLHVHLDQRTRDASLSYTALFNVQSLLRKSQPEFRQLNKYCNRNKNASFSVTQERNDSERYSVINTHAYKKFQTLEIRIHQGTANCVQIINWCKFLTGVINNAAKITKPVDSVDALLTLAPSISKVGLDYVKNRIEEFGNEEVG